MLAAAAHDHRTQPTDDKHHAKALAKLQLAAKLEKPPTGNGTATLRVRERVARARFHVLPDPLSGGRPVHSTQGLTSAERKQECWE